MNKIWKGLKKKIQTNSLIRKYYLIFRELPPQLRKKPSAYFLYKQLNDSLREGSHEEIANLIKNNQHFSQPFFLLFLAKSLFLRNQLDQAVKTLQSFFLHYLHHPDACYLYAEILSLQQKKHNAWETLEMLLNYSKRRKTWQVLSNLVDNEKDFEQYISLFQRYFPLEKNGVPINHLSYDLISHFANAAQRGGKIKFALLLWQNHYQNCLKYGFDSSKHSASSTSKKYTDKLASRALSDLKTCLDTANITFFLISGTLLGCIREGKMLQHDKDIDIGIWQDQKVRELIETIRCSGYFYILPSSNDDILVVRHVNGVTIDIFSHYDEKGNYFHAGGKCRWRNTPFTLAPHKFLDDQYLIPENYSLYLTENYGNWEIPNKEFDSALDTPNMEVTNIDKMLIYLYKRLSKKPDIQPSLRIRLEQKLHYYQNQVKVETL